MTNAPFMHDVPGGEGAVQRDSTSEDRAVQLELRAAHDAGLNGREPTLIHVHEPIPIHS